MEDHKDDLLLRYTFLYGQLLQSARNYLITRSAEDRAILARIINENDVLGQAPVK